MSVNISNKNICYECIGEVFLSNEIKNKGEIIICSYCGLEETAGYSTLKFSDRVHLAFKQHYDRMSENYPEDWSIEQIKEFASEWEPDGMIICDAIADAMCVSHEIACDIQKLLEEENYSRSSMEIHETSDYGRTLHYDIKNSNDEEWQNKWIKFENILKTKNRFFNSEAIEILELIFKDIENLKTHDGIPVTKSIGENDNIKELYRGRVFQSDESLKVALKSPNIELGPPPSKYAKAGRMNALGISVFYGATTREAALSEIRPPVGCKVAIGTFKILRPLRVLDIGALISTSVQGSIFDKNYKDLLSKATFLRNLGHKLTKAIMPNDEQFEYLPTQAISDFLSSEIKFDGIIFPSAQSGGNGVNVVLFNHASRIKEMEYPTDSDITVRLG